VTSLVTVILTVRNAGSQYIDQMKLLPVGEAPSHLSERTSNIIAEEQRRDAEGAKLHGKSKWAEIVRQKVLKPSKRQACNSYHVASNEHMSNVDCVDGEKLRKGQGRQGDEENEKTSQLVVVSPHIDGRLQDIGR
jgi:5'-nucleotidase